MRRRGDPRDVARPRDGAPPPSSDAGLIPASSAEGVRPVALRGEAAVPEEVLRAPASGLPCVYWRLRVFELVAPGVEFVHEAASDAPVDLRARLGGVEAAPAGAGDAETRSVLLQMDRVRVEAQPTLHRPGSPGAERVARRLGLPGPVRVEEVLIKPGEALEVEGLLLDPRAADAADTSLFRTSGAPAELVEATVRLPGSVSLRPALLPWALGTAAAVLGAAGVVTTLAKLGHLWRARVDLPTPAPAPEIGSIRWKRPKWP